ncbi:MAG TPA: NADH-quinone oxidoreductase subunit M [Verrucomicrobiae bacterium]|nr:NADH-quinone oxidoreductase subunit M [Verrucomicrobiae bacterium]
MLAWTIYSSFLAAFVVWLIGRDRPVLVRFIALVTTMATLVIALIGTLQLDPAHINTIAKHPWVPSLGITYYLAADGISATLVILTALAAVAGVLFSWNIEKRTHEFFGLYLALIGGVFGVFLSFDLFLLFVFYEIAIIPKYFLIAIWGSTRKEYGAMKLALYSFGGSSMVLIGILATYAMSPSRTFNLVELVQTGSVTGQAWLFPLTFVGFAILAGLWPFHTWAPTGHVAAPTAASMLLAGVVMKLGAYGALRVAMALFPEGLKVWQTTFAVLSVIGILYGAAVALTQSDFKYVIGYSSVSHMGFVLLGLMSVSVLGVSGAVLQMFSHGIIAGLLFAVVGRMLYERTHTRDLKLLESSGLAQKMPFAALTFLLACFASMGFPGFSGFIAEVSILMGSWKTFPAITLLAGLGILIGVGFTLRALQKSFYPGAVAQNGPSEDYHPITIPERTGAFLLLGATIVVGLFPKVLYNLIEPAIRQDFFKRIISG